MLVDLARTASFAAVQNGFAPGVHPMQRENGGDNISEGEYDLFVRVTYEQV